MIMAVLNSLHSSMLFPIILVLLLGCGVLGNGREAVTLATFNTALAPYYFSFNGTDRIPERTTLLIQKVC